MGEQRVYKRWLPGLKGETRSALNLHSNPVGVTFSCKTKPAGIKVYEKISLLQTLVNTFQMSLWPQFLISFPAEHSVTFIL